MPFVKVMIIYAFKNIGIKHIFNFVASLGIEPRSEVPETPILSVVLQGLFFLKSCKSIKIFGFTEPISPPAKAFRQEKLEKHPNYPRPNDVQSGRRCTTRPVFLKSCKSIKIFGFTEPISPPAKAFRQEKLEKHPNYPRPNDVQSGRRCTTEPLTKEW